MEISEAAKRAVRRIQEHPVCRDDCEGLGSDKVTCNNPDGICTEVVKEVQQAINEATAEKESKLQEYHDSLVAQSRLLHEKDTEVGRLNNEIDALRLALKVSSNTTSRSLCAFDELKKVRDARGHYSDRENKDE